MVLMIKTEKTIIIFVVFITTVTVGLYIKEFGFGLWSTNVEWANLGAFFGGVLGTIFSFATVVLLLISQRDARKYNEIQISSLRRQHLNEFFRNSLVWLKSSITSNKKCEELFIDYDVSDFFTEANKWVIYNLEVGENTDITEDAWNTAEKLIKKNYGLFDTEAALLWPLLEKINGLEDHDEQDYYRNLLNGFLTNDQRFWLEVYCSVWSIEFKCLTEKPLFFSNLPTVIAEKIYAPHEIHEV